MRHRSALFMLRGMLCAAALLLGLAAQAQLPITSIDWLLDRGGINSAPGVNPPALRQGYNDFLAKQGAAFKNSPGNAARKWVYPPTRDLGVVVIVDNPNPDGNKPKGPVGVTTAAPTGPVEPANSTAQLRPNIGTWTFPAPANRAPFPGYSYATDTTQAYTNDYAYVFAKHNDFIVTRGTGNTGPATPAELAQLPNAPSYVYNAVHQTLNTTAIGGQPTAVWTSGTQYTDANNNVVPLPVGRYFVDIYSPGDGTQIADQNGNLVAHPNVLRAFVRLSWGANPTDPVTSRIFLVDLSQKGWIRIHGGSLGPAAVPYDGTNPITVTLYSLTPDDITLGANSPYTQTPIVTADAVRFTPTTNQGRILGPAVSTSNLTQNPPVAPGVFPVFYFAREQVVDDTTIRSAKNPTLPVTDANGANPPIADPTATSTAPVFYCVDNRPGNTTGGATPAADRLRWRYVGVPDDNAGTASASPLLANVRCRDGVTRPMVFFVTTNLDGSLGRVYALDPHGGFTTFDNQATKFTWAYWVYPSYRPARNDTTLATNLPPNTAPQYYDPNYTLPNNLPNTYPARTSIYPAFGYGADSAVGTGTSNVTYYDGDLQLNNNALIVRANTQLPEFGGVQASPLITDDPTNPNGAQLLIVGNMNGRIYAFDAGGRGDFTYNATDNHNPFNGVANIPGTTQRIWTWPRFGADKWRYVSAANTQAPVPDDDPAKGAFPSSPTQNPAATNAPVIIGSADGHLYAVVPAHDNATLIVNGVPNFTERLNWLYPGPGKSLGTALSTAAIFKGNIYFTCGGRVYAVNETPATGTFPITNTLTWVYPWTDNPPFPSANPPNANSDDPNDTTQPLTNGFNGTAPVVVDGTQIGTGLPDMCYVLQGVSGKILALNATGANGKTTLVASGTTSTGANSRSTPILSLITGMRGLASDNGAAQHPALIFADDDGAIWALRADPIALTAGGPQNFLEVLWRHRETTMPRSASAILSNGVLVEGDEGGQLRAYSTGTDTVGSGEPPEYGFGVGYTSIDLRGLDIYKKEDWDRFMLTPASPNWGNQATPAHKENGTGFIRTLNPLLGEPTAGALNLEPIFSDWGDQLYVAAYGVYHAQTPEADGSPGLPTVTVTFTFTRPNQTTQPFTVTVPAVLERPGRNFPMPDDLGITDGELGQIRIRGFNAGGTEQVFTGNNGAYPWVAKVKIPIIPDAQNALLPGSAGYQITARAQIQQPNIPLGAAGGFTTDRKESNTLALGQRDYEGLSVPNADTSNTLEAQPSRTFYMTHPLALSIRGLYDSDMTQNQPGIIGWSNRPDVNTLADKREVLGNGNRLLRYNSTVADAIKALFAPIDMIQDGSSASYTALDNNGNRAPAFYLIDRSNMWTIGRKVSATIFAHSLRFRGGAASVLNPLPWETMPTDDQESPDYPSIPSSALSVKINGSEATEADVPLNPPTGDMDNPQNRLANPTPAELTVSVPKYQPANINRGVVTFGGKTFGGSLTDISGRVRGANGNTDPIIGPMVMSSGQPVAAGDARAFPAAGYTSEILVVARPANTTAKPPAYSKEYAFYDSTEVGASTIPEAYRAVEVGLSVPPTFRLRMTEQTIDLGREPHGTGYSDTASGGSIFAPTGVGPYTTQASPWNSETGFGDFFRPFTLISESNVNLVNLRIAKAKGIPGSQVNISSLTDNPPANVAASARLASDQAADNLPLFALPFAQNGYPGNIGIVTSFDHANQTNSNPSQVERDLWGSGLANPAVTAEGINAAGLTSDGWTAGFQPRPVAIKPRPGDTQGPTVTVPAKPYAFLPTDPDVLKQFQPPQIGVAIPLGTPIGTYSNPVFAYEDNVPIQWREWVQASGSGAALGTDGDGILNVDPANPDPNAARPIEAYSDPSATLKVRVSEARLTKGVTPGTVAQIDPLTQQTFGADLLPAAFREANASTPNIHLYWTTNRQPNGTPTANSPFELAYSSLPSAVTQPDPNAPFYFLDYQFANRGNDTTAQWWTAPTAYPGYAGNGDPLNLDRFFPSTAAESNGSPILPGKRVPQTTRYASPAVAQAVRSDGALDSEAWLFWQGVVDKLAQGATQASLQSSQQDSRTFYAPLVNGVPGEPRSFLNDPALTKLSPRPLLLKLDNGQTFLYLFWHAGNQSQTTLYYNVNTTAGFPANGWSQDQKLPTPGALAWQSDPYPVYRRIVTNVNGTPTVMDAIDVVYTGVLKNRQAVEVLLTRYAINRVPPQTANDPPLGALTAVQLPAVQREILSQVGKTATWAARDAAWYRQGTITLDYQKNGVGALLPLASGRGRLDPASGLVYFDSALGGQVVVDVRSGTVSFPNVPPGPQDRVIATYVPQVMRLNTNRDQTTVLSNGVTLTGAAMPLQGNRTNPIALLDTGVNPRWSQNSPSVIFNFTPDNNHPGPPVDRLWVLYRGSGLDIKSPAAASIYYKSLRLMVRLPRPFKLTAPDANGRQQIAQLTVQPDAVLGHAVGPYEVDWARGRIYFTEADEGNIVNISYMGDDGQTYTLNQAPIAWGDEITVTGEGETTHDTAMDVGNAKNEGQVSAFKDPFGSKLWVFWTSTRAGTTDLFYQTLAPQFYTTP
ncbi:MAG TPA: hypothetical protein VFB21_02450 [Chthonomonadaceae bacterium]|nr:hypothetical protein [Chthonomonadaceae bacterium]